MQKGEMMQGIKDRVAIVGMGCTKFGEHWDKSANDLMVDAFYEAVEDAGISPSDIQAAWLGTSSSGRRGSMLAYPLKLDYIPVTRVENACATGTDAMRNACYAVAAGIYDVVLVSGVEKLKDSGYSGLPLYPEVTSSQTDPPCPAPVQFALAATRYFHHYGLSFEEGKRILAQIAVKNHHNGTMSPKAHFHREITVEQVLKAPMVAWPLGLFDCCGVSDGSAAAIITRADLAPSFRKDYVLVKGLGVACGAREAQTRNDYDFVHFEENVRAAKTAYREAGIEDPRKEISVAEVHDCFTITELIIYEDLGLSPRGGGPADVEAGTFSLEGEVAVNSDGGLKCFGHPIGASGIRMIYEVYKQLQGKADKRQRKDPRIGITHNLGGAPGWFTSAVCVLGRPD